MNIEAKNRMLDHILDQFRAGEIDWAAAEGRLDELGVNYTAVVTLLDDIEGD